MRLDPINAGVDVSGRSERTERQRRTVTEANACLVSSEGTGISAFSVDVGFDVERVVGVERGSLEEISQRHLKAILKEEF